MQKSKCKVQNAKWKTRSNLLSKEDPALPHLLRESKELASIIAKSVVTTKSHA
jgi:hypothetical protein